MAYVLAGSLLLTGCAAVTPRPFRGDDHRLLTVPFFPDNTDQCGPSALAGVLSFWGEEVTPKALKKEVYLAQMKGSLSLDLMLAAKRRGFTGDLSSGSLGVLKEEIDGGRPVIAFLNRGLRSIPIGHYVVVTGYDEARRGLYVHSGRHRNKFASYKAFEKAWVKTERSMLRLAPAVKEDVHATQ